MSRFVNMTKSLGEYLSRALTMAGCEVYADKSKMSSGFSRWRSSYQQLSKRKEIQRKTSSQNFESDLVSGGSFLHSLRRRHKAMQYRFNQVGLDIASMLSGMRMARLLSINAFQASSTLAPLFKPSIRTKCGRENCADPCDWPVCPPGNKTHYRPENTHFNIYEAYWEEKHEACCDNCDWANTRFDDIYMRDSDKENRIYQRTWWECPIREIRKRVCCLDEGTPPEYCKRPKRERPSTAACMRPCEDIECPRIVLPCCCPVRKITICKPITRGLQDCKKFCAPYPSFSECVRKRPLPKHPRECECFRIPFKCEINEYYRNRFPHRSEGCTA